MAVSNAGIFKVASWHLFAGWGAFTPLGVLERKKNYKIMGKLLFIVIPYDIQGSKSAEIRLLLTMVSDREGDR